MAERLEWAGGSESGAGKRLDWLAPNSGTDQAGTSATPKQTPAEVDATRYAAGEDPGQRAFLKSATLGWIDELSADQYAATVGAENLYRKATGKPVPYGIGEARQAALHAQRQSEQDFSSRHPYLDEALSLGGGMMIPGAGKASEFVKAGKSALTRAGRSALVGSGFGAVAGASDPDDRTGGAVVGAVEGGGVAGSLHLLGSAVASGLPSVAKRMGAGLHEAWSRITTMFGAEQADITPEQRQQALKKALKYVHDVAQNAGKTPEQIRQNPDFQSGKPVLGAEAIGRPGVTQLSALGRRAGQTPDALESTLRQRADAAPSRVLADLQQTTGVDPASVEGNFGEQLKQLRQKAKPFYDVAYEKSVDSPDLRQFLVRPSVKKALARARSIAEEEGLNAEEIGLVTVGRMHQVGQHIVDTPETIEVRTPTVKTWDYIKRGLDDVLESRRDKVTGKLDLDEEGRAIVSTLRDLRTQLFKESPEYEHAVSLGGEAPRQQDAYRDAPKLMSNSVTESQFNQRIEKFTPAQKEALKGGFVSDVYNRARTGKLRLKDMQTPAFIYKSQQILGPDAAGKFLSKTQAEMRLAATGGRMMPGAQSATMELSAADKEQIEGFAALEKSARHAVNGDWPGAILHAIGSPFAGLYRGAQTPIDTATRDEVGRLLMLAPDQLADRLEKSAASTKETQARKIVREFMTNPAVLDVARRVAISTGSNAARP